MAVYHIDQQELAQFCLPGYAFVSFDQFGNIVQRYRDGRYAAENIEHFARDIGQAYNLWTVTANSRYRRNLFIAEVPDGVYISLNVPAIETNAVFPLRISIFDEVGEYFSQYQDIAVEKRFEGREGQADHFRLVAWRKVESIRDFVISESEKLETK